MNEQQRWAVAYAGPVGGGWAGPERIAEVLEASRCWATPERTVLVVQESERPWWSVLSGAFADRNVLAEPFDRGAGTGIIAALLLIAQREEDADVAVVYGPVPPAWMCQAAETTARRSPEVREPVVFRMPGEPATAWPVAVAGLQAWLRRAESIDRSRVAALKMALERAYDPSTALDGLYPFLTALDFERELLAAPGESAGLEPRPVERVGLDASRRRPSEPRL